MYFHGKETRKRIPNLPDANDNEGHIELNKPITSSILYLGESTIAGVGVDSHANGFAGYMSREMANSYQININYQVIAKSGWKAIDLYNNLHHRLPDRSFQLIVLGLGGNDSFQFTSPTKWVKATRQLVHLLQNQYGNTPILFCNLPPTSEFIAFPPILKSKIGKMTDLLRISLKRSVDKIEGVYFQDESISLENWSRRHNLESNPALYFSDGVHPSELTYKIWAKESAGFAKASGISI